MKTHLSYDQLLRIVADHYASHGEQIAAWFAHAVPETALVLEAARAIDGAAERLGFAQPPVVRTEQWIGPRMLVDLAVFPSGCPHDGRERRGAYLFEFKVINVHHAAEKKTLQSIHNDWNRLKRTSDKAGYGIFALHHHLVDPPTPGLRWSRLGATKIDSLEEAEQKFGRWFASNLPDATVHRGKRVELQYLNDRFWLQCNLLEPTSSS